MLHIVPELFTETLKVENIFAFSLNGQQITWNCRFQYPFDSKLKRFSWIGV